MIKKSLLPAILFSIILIMLMAGCAMDNSTSENTGAISAVLIWEEPAIAKVAVYQTITPDRVRVTVSGPNIPDPVTGEWDFAEGGGLLTGIPAGPHANLTALGIDTEGNILYKGVYLDFEIIAGETIDVTVVMKRYEVIADAGADQIVTVGSTVYLDGSNSSVPPGETATFSWQFTQRPEGSNASLVNAGTATPSFVADLIGTYVVQLTVTSSSGLTDSDDVMITANPPNQPPVAIINPSATSVSTGTMITLDGRNSYDPDGQALSYSWSLAQKPQDSLAELTNATSSVAHLTPDVEGTYIVQLIVNDGALDSDPATVEISVSSGGGY